MFARRHVAAGAKDVVRHGGCGFEEAKDKRELVPMMDAPQAGAAEEIQAAGGAACALAATAGAAGVAVASLDCPKRRLYEGQRAEAGGTRALRGGNPTEATWLP
jgi:hypothetical protein